MSTPFTYVEKLHELITDIPADSIVSRSIHKDDYSNITLFAFAAGQELTEHTSSQPAILYFVEGEAALTLGDETMVAAAGTWVQMQPHLPHSIVATTSLLMLLILIKSR